MIWKYKTQYLHNALERKHSARCCTLLWLSLHKKNTKFNIKLQSIVLILAILLSSSFHFIFVYHKSSILNKSFKSNTPHRIMVMHFCHPSVSDIDDEVDKVNQTKTGSTLTVVRSSCVWWRPSRAWVWRRSTLTLRNNTGIRPCWCRFF